MKKYIAMLLLLFACAAKTHLKHIDDTAWGCI